MYSPLSWFHTRSSRWRDWVILTKLLKPLSFLPFGRGNVNNSEYSSLFIFQDSCRAQTLSPSILSLPPLLASLCKGTAGGERDQQVDLKEVERRVESPGWNEKCDDSWKMQSHTYKASLWMDQAVEVMEQKVKLNYLFSFIKSQHRPFM